VFSTHDPRTTARASLGRRLGAAITALTLGGAFALAGATSASASDEPVSWAEGRILSGSVLGIDVDSIAAFHAAQAANNGNQPTQTSKDPFQSTVLDAATVGNGSSTQADLGGVVQFGAVGQYAQARADGKSFAASGAIMDDGAIGIGDDKTVPGTNATVDLNALLGDKFTSTLIDLDLAIAALAAQAQADGQNASGSYVLAGLELRLSSPAISALTKKVNAALDEVESSLAILDGDDGLLAIKLNKLLQGIDPALNLLGGHATVTASIDIGDLHKLVQDLLKAQYGQQGVTFNLETGVVTIDLNAFAGGGLNNAAPGTEVLSPAFINPILDSITDKIAYIADQVVDRVRAALHDAVVEVHAKIDLDIAQSPLVQKICKTVQEVIQVPTEIVKYETIQVPVIDGVVGTVINGVVHVNGVPVTGVLVGTSLTGLLGIGHTVTWITQSVAKTVTVLVDKTIDKVVCSNKITALPSLETSARVDLVGTVDQFLGDSGVVASAKIKVLGVLTTKLKLDLVIDGIADCLIGELFDGDGAIQKLVNALDAGLIDPAVEGLLDSDHSVGAVLTDLLSIKINNQELSHGTFTETALRVSVLGGNGAVINLAQASVGPNVTQVDDEDPCVDCGVGGETTTPTGGGAGGGGVLAMTGASIALLIAMIIALLAAGAYLVREGYRNRHATVSTD
jgi:hypothetical protein